MGRWGITNMKKHVTASLLLLLAVCGAAIISSCGSDHKAPAAVTSPESDFTISTKDGTVTITDYTGRSAAVGIPATIGGNPVVEIGENVFYNRKGITSISIPEGVTSIGVCAFAGCAGLTSLTIPASVTTIGDVAFASCTGLTSISIPEGVTSIGLHAFADCTGLTSISIPESVTSIGEGAFFGCTGLTTVTIPAGVASIDDAPFINCTGLTSIQVNTNNKNYTSRDGVLFNKTGDTLIACPTGLKGQYAIPAGVTSIRSHAFAHCIGLTSVSIPEGVTTIERYAFSDCTGLTSVSIPASVTSIGEGAFLGCIGLTSIQVDTNNKNYLSRNGVLFSKTGDELITCPTGLKGQYAIPAGVTRVWKRAFYGCTGLSSINIPAGVTRIGEEAFRDCTGLSSVSIPESVTRIGEEAFYGWPGLTSIRIGANVSMGINTSRWLIYSFENGFDDYYDTNGKKAGLYTFRNDEWSYSGR
ncbi:hypothetical protein FACS189461_2930 [Spirochaetia bacterium]|nr:hypothetical protein FACS189461_2930 [Spirochaetia bacterium]